MGAYILGKPCILQPREKMENITLPSYLLLHTEVFLSRAGE